MSRPRSKDKRIPITIAIPTSLAMKLENELSHSQSRSKWVSDAIENKLLDIRHNPITERTTTQLMAQLSQRNQVSESLKHLIILEMKKLQKQANHVQGNGKHE